MYEELRKFKDWVGHCNVPSSSINNPKLGRWVGTQPEMRLKISKERTWKLDSIGFAWDRNQDVRWEITFDELRIFKERKGHCDVPQGYSHNP